MANSGGQPDVPYTGVPSPVTPPKGGGATGTPLDFTPTFPGKKS